MATANSRTEGNLHVTGNLAAASISYPPGSIEDEDIAPAAAIDASKVIHQQILRYSQAEVSDVVAVTMPIHICYGAAAVVAVEVLACLAPAGGDKKVTVDVQWGDNNDAFASILQAPIVYDSTASDREVFTGLVTKTNLKDNDVLRVVVTPSGSSGTQAQGLVVSTILRENPQ